MRDNLRNLEKRARGRQHEFRVRSMLVWWKRSQKREHRHRKMKKNLLLKRGTKPLHLSKSSNFNWAIWGQAYSRHQGMISATHIYPEQSTSSKRRQKLWSSFPPSTSGLIRYGKYHTQPCKIEQKKKSNVQNGLVPNWAKYQAQSAAKTFSFITILWNIRLYMTRCQKKNGSPK